jgi:hypothetical protein
MIALAENSMVRWGWQEFRFTHCFIKSLVLALNVVVNVCCNLKNNGVRNPHKIQTRQKGNIHHEEYVVSNEVRLAVSHSEIRMCPRHGDPGWTWWWLEVEKYKCFVWPYYLALSVSLSLHGSETKTNAAVHRR